MAAASLHPFSSSLPNPNPNPSPSPNLSRHGAFCHISSSPFFGLYPSCRGRLHLATPRLGAAYAGGRLRMERLVAFAASGEESKDSELDVNKVKTDAELKAEEAQEAWRQTLEQFKAEALRVKAMTMQAYDVYSKKTMEILLQTSEKLKIQADKAQKDLSVIASEVGEEGQQYLTMAAENSPDSVRDIMETFRSLHNLKGLSEYDDYHVGVPFGTFLMVGGFLNFMLTGSIPAIRFGFILGAALLLLSISSLRLRRVGRASPLLLKGQAATASVIFLRELSVLLWKGSFPTLFLVLVSATVAAFYIYRIVTGGHRGPSIEHGSEN